MSEVETGKTADQQETEDGLHLSEKFFLDAEYNFQTLGLVPFCINLNVRAFDDDDLQNSTDYIELAMDSGHLNT
jgi:hypothetical protein